MKYVINTCGYCGIKFDQLKSEFCRNKKIGRMSFCCLSHVALFWNRINNKGNLNNLKCNNRQDEYSSFRYYVHKARSSERIRKYGVSNITIEYLKELWEKQNGKCPYTNISIELPRNTQDHNIKCDNPWRASLDRIDTQKGYIRENVEFICLGINLLKRDFTKSQVQEMIDVIKVHGNKSPS